MAEGASDYTQDNQRGRLTTELGKDALLLLSLTATERLSESYSVTIEAFAATPKPLHTLLGTAIGVTFDADEALSRDFAGVLWEYEELGVDERGNVYRLTLRPPTEFMTLNKRNRIFQNKSAIEIAKTLIPSDYQADINSSYDPMEYCVQYQESDFDFLSRLLEYEGIYYYYSHTGSAAKLVLIDDGNAHPSLSPDTAKVRPDRTRRSDAPVWSVTERRKLGPAKLSAADYDFEAPETQLLKTKTSQHVLGQPTMRAGHTEAGSAGDWSDTAELYEFPAKYDSKSTTRGERYTAQWLDAHRRRMARSFADGELFAAAVGRRVTLDHADGISTEYLIVGTKHDYVVPGYDSGQRTAETFRCEIELMPASEQYRPAQRTPRPRILGPQTAIVVGPSGEEIHTDKYGRIKVQFFWDRDGKKDENSSCFVRVMQAGAGQGWGSFALPRIGQEVVVEFMDGDPDRPLVTGAVYNGSNGVPETLPDNKTQFGMKSRISKGGGGYNRLWFEDKKDSEVVWFRAERDYKANIVNKDEERTYDKGNRTTTFKEGDDTKTLDKGSLTTLISKGDETRTISTGKRTTTIKDNDTLEVQQGNRAATIKMGNDTLTVSTGNVEVKVTMGKHTTEAAQAIELTCGGSKIKMDPMQISLEAATIKIDAKLMLQMKGLMVQSEASTMHIVKGGLVMIN